VVGELAGQPHAVAAGAVTAGHQGAGRRGVELPEAEPVTVLLEQYFLPLDAGQEHLAGQISRAQAVNRMLAARDEDGLTPAEAVAAGGAALERVRALVDDCEWRRHRQLNEGQMCITCLIRPNCAAVPASRPGSPEFRELRRERFSSLGSSPHGWEATGRVVG
jgi:hypothetical protein